MRPNLRIVSRHVPPKGRSEFYEMLLDKMMVLYIVNREKKAAFNISSMFKDKMKVMQ